MSEGDETIEFTIKMSRATYNRLRSAVGVRIMSGAAHGIPDDFVRTIINDIEGGKREHEFTTKR